ncbi:MAG: hypothetical protein IJ072_03185, partial [Oscillospiraceae bacterium]|nr:hypothetical protein [Oscillospiraceae bacterium]
MDKIPFYEMFDCCKDGGAIENLLGDACVVNAVVDRAKGKMNVTVMFSKPAPPVYISIIEQELRANFELSAVSILPIYLRTMAVPADKGASEKKQKVILGRAMKNPSITPMDTITVESGKVTVRGEIFEVQTREITKARAWVLSFDMTDYTGSIHVSKFMRDENAKEICAKISPGMFVTVSGT